MKVRTIHILAGAALLSLSLYAAGGLMFALLMWMARGGYL